MDNRVKRFFGDRSRLIALALLGFLAVLPVAGARAQAIVGSVNGDPITTLDLAEREKLLRAIGQPSSPSAALDSLIETRVKAREVNKYNIHVSGSELGPTLHYYAEKGAHDLAGMSQRIQAAHVDPKHVENFFSIQRPSTSTLARATAPSRVARPISTPNWRATRNSPMRSPTPFARCS